jgi:hypothetical protein
MVKVDFFVFVEAIKIGIFAVVRKFQQGNQNMLSFGH